MAESNLQVSGLDLVVMLYHLHRYAEKHGHDDADRTLGELTRMISFSKFVPKSAVESAMFCCNLLDEEGSFWHPQKAKFDEFARKVGKGRRFNKRYNWYDEVKK